MSRLQLTQVGILALERLKAEIGESFSFDQLIAYVERGRGKDLRIEEDTMPPCMTGYIVALKDCDLIATRKGLMRTQKWATQLHEIAHLIKGDVPLLSRGSQTTIYSKFIQRRDRHSMVTPRQRLRGAFRSIEDDAEIISRIFMDIIEAHSQSKHEALDDLNMFCDL